MIPDLIVYNNPLNTWMIAAGIAVGLFGSLRFAKAVVVRRRGRVAAQTETDLADLIVAILDRTHLLFWLPLAFYGGTLALSFPDRVTGWINNGRPADITDPSATTGEAHGRS
jgi:hypothetical protein